MIIRLGRLTPGYFRLLQVCETSPQSANEHLSSAEEAQRRMYYLVSGCLHPFALTLVSNLNPFRGAPGCSVTRSPLLMASVIGGDTNQCNIISSLAIVPPRCRHNAPVSSDPPYVSTIVWSLCSHIYTNLKTRAAPSWLSTDSKDLTEREKWLAVT